MGACLCACCQGAEPAKLGKVAGERRAPSSAMEEESCYKKCTAMTTQELPEHMHFHRILMQSLKKLWGIV
eukprot:4046148-Amphidinium_carterae.1